MDRSLVHADVPPSETPLPRFAALLSRITGAGVLAGTLAGLWSLLVTQRAIRPALAIEEARNATGAVGQGHDDELVSRGTQVAGGVLGTVLAGVVLAVVLAVAFAGTRHRLPARSDFGRMVLLTSIGFAAVVLLPAVKIPANPPAVGDPSTIGERTALYGGVVATGLAIALVVTGMVSAFRSRGVSVPGTAIAAVAATTALVALVVVLFPDSPDRVPADVPAAVVWDFRLASLGQVTVLWAGLGLIGGALVDRLSRLRPGTATRP